MKKYFKLALVIFLSTTFFFVSSFLYLNGSLKESEKTVDEKIQNIPYSKIPENCGLLLNLPNDESVLFFLDFESIILYIVDVSGQTENFQSYVGYPIDYKCEIDYYTLSLFLDRIGGIDFIKDEQMLRLSGIQICDILSENNSPEVSFDIINEICDKLSKTGLSNEDFVFLISNCNTDLTMPVCLYWQEFMPEMFLNRVFVNWES